MTDIYDSATAGRAQFRNAYREERNKNKALQERVEQLEAALRDLVACQTGVNCIGENRECLNGCQSLAVAIMATSSETKADVPVDLQSNCPYAFPHRYCQVCPVQPCPAGVPQRPTEKTEAKHE